MKSETRFNRLCDAVESYMPPSTGNFLDMPLERLLEMMYQENMAWFKDRVQKGDDWHDDTISAQEN